MGVFSFVKAGKKVFDTIKSVKPAVGSLTKRRKDVDEIFNTRTRHGTSPNKRIGETVKKVSAINDRLDKLGPGSSNPKRPGKKDGGRMGLKRGTGLMSKKKSNIQKIKETFGPGSSNPKKSAAKKKKSFPDLNKDGKVTFADILKGRGVKRG